MPLGPRDKDEATMKNPISRKKTESKEPLTTDMEALEITNRINQANPNADLTTMTRTTMTTDQTDQITDQAIDLANQTTDLMTDLLERENKDLPLWILRSRGKLLPREDELVTLEKNPNLRATLMRMIDRHLVQTSPIQNNLEIDDIRLRTMTKIHPEDKTENQISDSKATKIAMMRTWMILMTDDLTTDLTTDLTADLTTDLTVEVTADLTTDPTADLQEVASKDLLRWTRKL